MAYYLFRQQAIAWTNADLLPVNLYQNKKFSIQKIKVKVWFAKWWPFNSGLHVLTHWPLGNLNEILDM